MRHQHELIRDLGRLLRTRMTTAGHLAQVNLTSEHRGNCLPPRDGCSDRCLEAQRLLALTEPFMPRAERPAPRPVKPLPRVVLGPRPTRRRARPEQPTLFEGAI